jgi:tetratricopeptide (TPR) repeat protein
MPFKTKCRLFARLRSKASRRRLQAEKHEADALFQLGLRELAALRWEQSASIFREFLARFPDSESVRGVLLNLATAEARLGNTQRAHNLAQRVIPMFQPGDEALILIAMVELQTGHPEEAEKLVLSVLRENERNQVALALMAKVREFFGDPIGMLNFTEQAIKHETVFDPELWCMQSRALKAVGQFDNASKVLREALSRAAAHPPAISQVHRGDAMILQEIGILHADLAAGPSDTPHVATAFEYLHRAVNQDPSLVDSWDRLARMHINIGNFEQAAIASQHTMRLAQAQLGIKQNRKVFLDAAQVHASALINLGDQEHAETTLDSAIAFAEAEGFPTDSLVRERILCLVSMDRWSEALELTETALQRGDNSALVRNARAAAYVELGNSEQAKEELEAALKIEPTDEIVQVNLAYMRWKYASSGDERDKAMEMYRSALGVEIPNPSMWARFCAMAEFAGKSALADEYTNRACRLFDDESNFAEHFTRAKNSYMSDLENFPNNPPKETATHTHSRLRSYLNLGAGVRSHTTSLPTDRDSRWKPWPAVQSLQHHMQIWPHSNHRNSSRRRAGQF